MKINIVKNRHYPKNSEKPFALAIQSDRNISIICLSFDKLTDLIQILSNQLQNPMNERKIIELSKLNSDYFLNIALNSSNYGEKYSLIYFADKIMHVHNYSFRILEILINKLRMQLLNPLNEDDLYQKVEIEL